MSTLRYEYVEEAIIAYFVVAEIYTARAIQIFSSYFTVGVGAVNWHVGKLPSVYDLFCLDLSSHEFV